MVIVTCRYILFIILIAHIVQSNIFTAVVCVDQVNDAILQRMLLFISVLQ